jgi:hypothetical protein
MRIDEPEKRKHRDALHHEAATVSEDERDHRPEHLKRGSVGFSSIQAVLCREGGKAISGSTVTISSDLECLNRVTRDCTPIAQHATRNAMDPELHGEHPSFTIDSQLPPPSDDILDAIQNG